MQVHRTFSDERGLGAFHSLGALPKRKSDAAVRKLPVFHIAHDDDDDHTSSLDEHPVPFPRSTSPPSPSSAPRACSYSLSRGVSSPILLRNGKPLKPSLKTSSSAPTMSTPPLSQHVHLRAHSAPSTPAGCPKTVHFPEKDYGLATVRVFDRKARPAALSCPTNTNGDETETEGEDTTPNGFPFPFMPPVFSYEIDPTKSSFVPCKSSPHANILLESLDLSSSSSSTSSGSATKPLLTGSVLVRNLAFEKYVATRFTLDDWQTVSEVSAHYVDSLSTLPSRISPSSSTTTSDNSTSHMGRGWDRFTFTIRLEDYAHSLSTRTMWLASRYRINSTYLESGSIESSPGGEWWDNNGGCNYRVGFRPTTATSPRTRPRRETVSAPTTAPRTLPQSPQTWKEHVLGHMVPSISNNKEIQNSTDKRPTPLRIGKLNLCNYAPPTGHATSSVSFPSAGSSPSQIKGPNLPPLATSRPLLSDDDATSPASSTLSTPSVSPMIAPRVIVGGQPATHPESASKDDAKPSHIADWEWSAPSKQRTARADTAPGPDTLLPPEKVLADHSLYDAFITQWCFAQGPSLNHSSYGDGGIMA